MYLSDQLVKKISYLMILLSQTYKMIREKSKMCKIVS